MPFQIQTDYGGNRQNHGFPGQQNPGLGGSPYYYQDLLSVPQNRASYCAGQGLGSAPPRNLIGQQPGHVTGAKSAPIGGFGKNVVETKYMLHRRGPMGSSSQANAAANFFARAHQKLQNNNHSNQAVFNRGGGGSEDELEENLSSNFRALIDRSPPPIPGQLLRKLEETSFNSVGKIRVILRVSGSSSSNFLERLTEDPDVMGNATFQMDRRRRQVTVYDPSALRGGLTSLEGRQLGVAAPKIFAFDNVFTSEDSQEEVAASTLTEVITSVVNGNDGCLFCFGHANLGKSRSMLGSDESTKSMGMIPIAIAWLYRAIKERKTRSGTKFSIRVSALEVTSQRETLRDLLENYSTESDQSPGVYLRNLPINRPAGSVPSTSDYMANLSELRASTAEKAGYYLDAALGSRSADTRGRESHLLFTLHVYQYSTENGATGGRSRLHLIDFGGCERTRNPGGGITLSGLGNVILSIFAGQKHLPHRESKVTQLLRECLGSVTCQSAMLAHVSPDPCHYSETLHTLQLASRLHRSHHHRRKRSKGSRSGLRSSTSGLRSSSGTSSSGFTTSTNPSSSELSCDTVVYRGQSDGSGTDGEHPPGLYRHGSFDDLPRRRKKILTNGAISPRNCASPGSITPRSPAPRSSSSLSGSCLPAIPEVVHNSGKMPLSGLVPIQSSHRYLRQQLEQQRVQQCQQSQKSQHSNSRRSNEIWIDEAPKKQPYGFMDEAKANMISTWVEDQTTTGNNCQADAPVAPGTPGMENGFRCLTQFKTVEESDESLDNAKVIVHQAEVSVNNNKAKPTPPPPPPRRTPPRESQPLGALETPADGCQVEQGKSLVSGIPETIPMIDDAEVIRVEESGDNVPTTEMACQVSEEELRQSSILNQNPDSECHPLRILSQENLSIVSSFADGTNGDIANNEDLINDEIDPSKLSFFKVPDFASNCQDSSILQTFQDFKDMQSNASASVRQSNNNGSADNSPVTADINNCFQDPRLGNQNFVASDNSRMLSTFSPSNNVSHSVFQNKPYDPRVASLANHGIMTPQKQFLLLSESLRHPDGSSNPELNVIPKEKDASAPPLAQVPVPEAIHNVDNDIHHIPVQRSPGNGRSSSDMEEDNNKLNNNPRDLNENGNNIINHGAEVCKIKEAKSKTKDRGFGFRFLRLFGSTRSKNKAAVNAGSGRSKSCDRKLEEESNEFGPRLKNRLSFGAGSSGPKSASASNSKADITADDCISTEWEFEPTEEDNNGDKRATEMSFPPCFDHILIQPGKKLLGVPSDGSSSGASGTVDTNRKSSGYESSSLDSNQGIKLSREMNNSLARAFVPGPGLAARSSTRSNMVHPEIQPLYALPTDQNGGNPLNLVQYDELDIMRLETRISAMK